jgi:hypothetical protein
MNAMAIIQTTNIKTDFKPLTRKLIRLRNVTLLYGEI